MRTAQRTPSRHDTSQRDEGSAIIAAAVAWTWACVAAWLLLASSAEAQPSLDQVTVTPLPGPASCHAGTAGADATMFLRENQNRIECDAFSGRTPCLARREVPADGPNGKPVSLEAAVVLRPSVTGDGSSVYFSGWGFNGCGMRTNSEDNEGCFGRNALGFDVHAVAVTPAGSRIGFTILEPGATFNPGNRLAVLDASSLAVREQYRVQVTGTGGGSLELESMDFTANGRYIVLDARNPATGLWGIYVVDRANGSARALVAPVSGLHLRNPALAQTSDDFMTFDVQDAVTGANQVVISNLLTGELTPAASTSILSYPGFNGDDTRIVFTDADRSASSRASLFMRELVPGRRTPAAGTQRARWLTDGGLGVIYRRGSFDATPREPSLCLAEYGTSGGGGAGNLPPVPRDTQALIPILQMLID